jgi:hypothetical protein
MLATQSAPAAAHQPELSVVTGGGEELALRSTLRGKTHLSLAELEAKVQNYPDDVRQATHAVQAFFVEQCNSDIQHLLGVARNVFKLERSPEYFSNWLKGYYFTSKASEVRGSGRASWIDFAARVSAYHAKLKSRGSTIVTGTIRAIHTHIFGLLDPDNPCRIGGMCGATGSQKTEGMRYTALKLGGFPRANYFNCTEGLSAVQFKRGLADLFNAKVGNKIPVLNRAIAQELSPDRALFIDNIQRAFDEEKEAHDILDFLMRIQEDRGFPLYVSFTEEFYGQLEKIDFLEQFVGRMGGKNDVLKLPKYPPVGDLRAIAKHYQLADSAVDDFLLPWSKERGRIRVVFKRLYRARKMAEALKQTRITLDVLEQVADWTPPAEIEAEGGES